MATSKICPQCQASFNGSKWVWPGLAPAPRSAPPSAELCPGCERIKRRRVDGVVHLGGAFLARHRDEAMNLIHNEADKRRHKNVAARVVSVEDENGALVVQTTDHSLAERIGKEFERAFSGELNIRWLPKEEFVRVTWTRED